MKKKCEVNAVRKIRKKIKIQKSFYLLIAVCLLTAAYATVSSTLGVVSSTKIGMNIKDLDYYIGNIFVDDINQFSYLSDDLTSFNVEVNGNVTIDYYLVNASTQYDMKPSITCSDIGVEITNNVSDLVSAQSVSKGTITVNTTETKNLLCLFSYELVERETISPLKKFVFYSSDGSKLTSAYKEYTTETNYVDLETPKRGNSLFMGWINKDGKTIDENSLITSDYNEILYATWSKLNALYIKYDNTKSNSTCETVKCALDELSEKF